MKLLTPQETLQAIIDGKRVEIRGAIDSHNSGWKPLNEHEIHIRVLTNGLFIFRLAKETITIGDVSFPKPESSPPKQGTKYWAVSITAHYIPPLRIWEDDNIDKSYLAHGLVHLSKENAIAHAKALIELSGGKVDE
ncbi:MAG: hypothetical protein Q4B81_04165 [Moraxella sp.]|nr:hypothetical protein [Moraxella sp.]